MQTGFQLASVHGMLYTGGNVVFSPDGSTLYSPVNNYLSATALQGEGHQSLQCSNSSIQCFDVSHDGDLVIAIGHRGLGFFYSLSARVVLDTISFPPTCTIHCVKFSPCSKYIALALESTLQIYTTPAKRVVSFHSCHRVENMHNILTLPIMHMDWTSDSMHLLLSGEDARMKIVPRSLQVHRKNAAVQQNALIGHRSAVLGAWFMASEDLFPNPNSSEVEEHPVNDNNNTHTCPRRVVSVAADNVVITWHLSHLTRKEVLQSIAIAQLRAKMKAHTKQSKTQNKKSSKRANIQATIVNDSNKEQESRSEEEEDENEIDDDDDDDDEEVPQSFLERQRLEELLQDGIRVPVTSDSYLPDILKEAFEVERKYMLTHKGAVTVTTFHKERSLLAIGYDSGIFAIHYVAPVSSEKSIIATTTTTTTTTNNVNNTTAMINNVDKPESNDTLPLIHLLSISAQALTAACFAPSGDLVAFGSAHLKQLLVWDWKNEAYVLKEQAHYYDIARCAITADALHILSGGDDGKVKVWSILSGQCVVTFNEHTGPITGIAVSAATNAFFTCSADGTARGFDLIRYRAFRTFTVASEEPQQFSCITVDPSGEVLALGSGRRNRIYLFAIQTGKVIDTLQGHESPIACIAFHPGGTTLASGALDSQLIFWDVFNSSGNDGGARLKGDGEVLDIGSEVLSLTYCASGRRMAVLTARQEVMVYETTIPTEPELVKTFSVGYDASGGWTKSIGPRSANYDAHFTRLTFSPEGDKLLLGGDSKWLVLYHATQGYVLKKWPVTTNLDVHGAEEQFQWRSQTEAGALEDLDMSSEDVHLIRRKLLEMPGSRHRHFATGQRKTERVARTMDLCFAPTATEFVAATTDGLLVFSLFVSRPRFTPLQLTSEITLGRIREQLYSLHQPVLALMGALLLGERVLGEECMRRIAPEAIPVAVSATPSSTYALLMQWVSDEVTRAPGLEHALLWAQSLLVHSSELIRGLPRERNQLHGPLKTLVRSLQSHRALSDLAQENYFALKYLRDMAKMNKNLIKPLVEEDDKARMKA